MIPRHCMTPEERDELDDCEYREREQRLIDARAGGYHAGSQLQSMEMCPEGFTEAERDAWVEGWLRGTWDSLHRGRRAA